MDSSSVADIAALASGLAATAPHSQSDGCDIDRLDPTRWEVSVNVDGTNVLTIGSHGYLAGYSDIDQFGDAVRAAAEHLKAFIGTGEPEPCFACGGSGHERWMGECGEEIGPCSVCGPRPFDPESPLERLAALARDDEETRF